MISLIACVDKNGGIGLNGVMPWWFTKDMKYFRDVTIGNTVIMGSTTFDHMANPLAHRRNVVLTSKNKDAYAHKFKDRSLYYARTIEEALGYGLTNETFVIGGAKIYEQFLPYADMLYLTKIDGEFIVDTYFPEVDFSEWEKTEERKDFENGYDLIFEVYAKKSL